LGENWKGYNVGFRGTGGTGFCVELFAEDSRYLDDALGFPDSRGTVQGCVESEVKGHGEALYFVKTLVGHLIRDVDILPVRRVPFPDKFRYAFRPGHEGCGEGRLSFEEPVCEPLAEA
jgi:hypothetical protein